MGGKNAQFTALSPYALSVKIPPGSGAAEVHVSTAAGTSAPNDAARVRYLADAAPTDVPASTTTTTDTATTTTDTTTTDTTTSGPVTTGTTTTTSPGQTAPTPPVVESTTSEGFSNTSRFVTPRVSAAAGRLLVAYVSTDAPARTSNRTTTNVSSLTSPGLSWRRVMSRTGKGGGVEVWQAYATRAVTGPITVTPFARTSTGLVTVAVFAKARTSVGRAGASTGRGTTASVTVPVAAVSVVWAVGHDGNVAVARTVPQGQQIISQYLAPRVRDSYWVQRVVAPAIAARPATVTASVPRAAAPGSTWELAAVEIPAAA